MQDELNILFRVEVDLNAWTFVEREKWAFEGEEIDRILSRPGRAYKQQRYSGLVDCERA